MRSVRKGLDTTYETSSPESSRFPKWRRQKREDPDEVAIWRSVIDEFDFQICARRVVIFFFCGQASSKTELSTYESVI